MSEQILIPRGMSVFVVAESTSGTPIFPAAGDAIQLRGGITMPSQPTSHTRLMEIAATASVTGLIRDIRDGGSLRLPFYLRPSGAAGTAPQEGPLLEAALGTETVSAGSSVTYSPSYTKSPHSIWFGLNTSNVVICAAGAAVNALTFTQSENGPIEAEAGAVFTKLVWAGETTLDGAVSGSATAQASCTVDDSTVFGVGAVIQIGTDTQSATGGGGYQITAINYTTHVLTVTPSIDTDQNDAAAVIPLALPTPSSVGAPLDLRAEVNIDGTAIAWKDWTINYEEAISMLTEVSATPADTDYPVDFARGDGGRTISASARAIMRTSRVSWLRANDSDQSFDVDYTHGSAGSQVVIDLPQGRYNVGETATADPSMEITLPFEGKASTGLEDEISIAYT